MHRVAQSWLVLQVTSDPTMLGLVVAFQFAPMLFLAPWAGVLADRYDRRRLLQITQVGMGLQALGLGILTIAGLATGPLVLGFALLLGLFTALDGPARQSIVSDLVPADQVVNAVALNSANFNAARLVGPAVAGVMIVLRFLSTVAPLEARPTAQHDVFARRSGDVQLAGAEAPLPVAARDARRDSRCADLQR